MLLTDIQLADMDSDELIENATQLYSEIVPIIVTTTMCARSAVRAMKNGAFDYVMLPAEPTEATEVLNVVAQAAKRRGIQLRNSVVESEQGGDVLDNVIGQSKAMQDIFRQVRTIAKTSSTVLITGESGTGKELIAQAIHANSPRRNQKIVSINCGAIPENLLESELFGHTKGAFTGALQTRIGRFEQAHKGTIFLDEIGTMSPTLQVKLLRVLQEREFERVGGSEKIKIDVRIIAATSAKLSDMLENNEFRLDLYYRLNVIPVKMPALRHRREDIPLLAKHFVQKYCSLAEMETKTISQEAMKMLMNASWQGNVRQLENAIERAVAMIGDGATILPSDLPEEIQESTNTLFLTEIYIPDEGLDFDTEVSAFERQLILESLKKTNGSRCEAAKLLGLKRTTLVEKLKRLNFQAPAYAGVEGSV